MKPYLIGLGIFFIGFIIGFFTAAVCAASGRASRMEERMIQGYQPDHGILNPENPPQGGSGISEF